MEKINTQIKNIFKTKENFCNELGYKYKDFGQKQRTLITKFNWINNFLRPLGLKIVITNID